MRGFRLHGGRVRSNPSSWGGIGSKKSLETGQKFFLGMESFFRRQMAFLGVGIDDFLQGHVRAEAVELHSEESGSSHNTTCHSCYSKPPHILHLPFLHHSTGHQPRTFQEIAATSWASPSPPFFDILIQTLQTK